ncbi:MAG: DUF1080 domain-containing protein [Chthoniobacter sp.]|nr:DUF1080 domain-containing protein [Chthoniobacter sp.]
MTYTFRHALLALLLCAASLASAAAEPGFKSIFNGQDLTGWDGRPGLWSVKDGCIRGETTATNRAPGNTFLIWRDGAPKNFELKLRYRILTGNNSGIQYRSRETDKWVVTGYQGEIVNQLGKTGFLYHEAGRGWLTDVGDFMEIDADGKLDVVGIVANRKALMDAPYHTDKEWNEYHIVCRGNHIVQYLNGYPTVELIDNHVDKADPKSPKQRSLEGVIALQIHGGAAMTVDFKDIRLKVLDENYGEARRLFNGVDLTGWKDADGKWSVVPLAEGTDSPRRTKPSGPLNVLKCAGGGNPAIGLNTPAPRTANFVLRFQRRVVGADKTGGDTPIKPVSGWETWEVEIGGKQKAAKIGVRLVSGVANEGWLPFDWSLITLPSDVAVEYRNIVLIPGSEPPAK